MIKNLTLLFSTCLTITACSNNKSCEVRHIRCVITDSKFQYRYGGVTTEGYYTYKTDSNYTVISDKKVNVGDTITLEIVDCKKNKIK